MDDLNSEQPPARMVADAFAHRTPAPGELPVIPSAQLFRHGNAVRIEHAGQHYLLRITRENKLILTK